MAKSLHDLWKKEKDKYKKDLDMSKVSDSAKLGAHLDVYEAKLKAYHALCDKLATKPDPAKEKAAKDAVVAAAKAAHKACGLYVASLRQVEKHAAGATKTAAEKLNTFLLFDISRELGNASNGQLPG